MSKLVVYEAPKGAAGRNDFAVRVRVPGEKWQELFVYEVKVDMHEVRRASMVYFDMEGTVEVEVESLSEPVEQVMIRPLSVGMMHRQEENRISFRLDRPQKLSIEINGQRFSNLHLFANPLETDAPDPSADHVLFLKPAIHRTEDIYRLARTPKGPESKAPDTLYFGPGLHWLEEGIL
ncbi:MAG: hypothetical protein K0Q90_3683, partial [Paenibacillaceae bacterium]|nr:hypothetical protein [Paenibacillaceae bacterium]